MQFISPITYREEQYTDSVFYIGTNHEATIDLFSVYLNISPYLQSPEESRENVLQTLMLNDAVDSSHVLNFVFFF